MNTALAKEGHFRSLAKAVTWRLTGTLDTFVVSWILSGHLALAGTIAGAEFVTKISLFYLHERAWNLVHWGKGRHSI